MSTNVPPEIAPGPLTHSDVSSLFDQGVSPVLGNTQMEVDPSALLSLSKLVLRAFQTVKYCLTADSLTGSYV